MAADDLRRRSDRSEEAFSIPFFSSGELLEGVRR
jgi:hypothetical protein